MCVVVPANHLACCKQRAVSGHSKAGVRKCGGKTVVLPILVHVLLLCHVYEYCALPYYTTKILPVQCTVRRVTILWHTSAKPQWVCGPGRVPRNRLTMLYDIASGTQVRPPVRRPAPTAPENRPPQKTKIATNLYNVEIKCFWGGTAFAKAVQPLPSRTSRSPGAP